LSTAATTLLCGHDLQWPRPTNLQRQLRSLSRLCAEQRWCRAFEALHRLGSDLTTMLRAYCTIIPAVDERSLKCDQLLQLASALAHLHANNILHRDVKSSNVFVTTTGGRCLGDLGMARTLAPGEQPRTTAGARAASPAWPRNSYTGGCHTLWSHAYADSSSCCSR
jgi:Protein kinase domain